MRAIVLLCLLHPALVASDVPTFTWPININLSPYVCLKDQASCGCCLMKMKMQRLESFFNFTYEKMAECLEKQKMALDDISKRSAFSVALNYTTELTCFGNLSSSRKILYNHTFLNLGNAYNPNTGIFTVPHSGVYSLSVTIYTKTTSVACGELMVNGTVVAKVTERKGTDQDNEDSATASVSVKLKAGDEVWVNLPKGCTLCDNKNHFNTFTGFLLYTDVQYSPM